MENQSHPGTPIAYQSNSRRNGLLPAQGARQISQTITREGGVMTSLIFFMFLSWSNPTVFIPQRGAEFRKTNPSRIWPRPINPTPVKPIIPYTDARLKSSVR
jgi:hypothetical protein